MPDTYVNEAPYEIIAGPVDLWIAPVGTAFPTPGVGDPPSPWVKVGTRGKRNYKDDGVTMVVSEETEAFTPLGSTMPTKMFRNTEDCRIKVILVDVSLEAWQIALNFNPIDESTPGFRKISLKRGFGVAQRAVLAVGPSAEGNGVKRHFQMPVAAMTSGVEVAAKKNEPQALALDFRAMDPEDDAGFAIIDELPAS